METKRLRYFLQIAEEGSVGRASEVLGVAQPALSRQMRQLEESLGAQLFVRSRRGMKLTEEGELLRKTLSRPMREVELALQNISGPLAPINGVFVLGLASTALELLGLPLLTQMRKVFPQVTVRILDGQPESLMEGLIRGEIDVALVPGPLPDERLFDRNMLTEELLLVGGPKAKLDPGTPVSFRELTRYQLVVPSVRPHGVRAILDKTALRVESRVEILAEIDSLQLTKEFVQTNAAYTVLPRSAFGREYEAGRLTYAPIKDPFLKQTLVFSVRQHLILPRRFVWDVGVLLEREITRLVNTGVWPATMVDPPERAPFVDA